MVWYDKVWVFIKKACSRFISFFKRKSKKALLQEKIKKYELVFSKNNDKLSSLLFLKKILSKNYEENKKEIEEIGRKIFILNQDLFAQKSELKRLKLKRNKRR